MQKLGIKVPWYSG